MCPKHVRNPLREAPKTAVWVYIKTTENYLEWPLGHSKPKEDTCSSFGLALSLHIFYYLFSNEVNALLVVGKLTWCLFVCLGACMHLCFLCV